LFDDLKIDVEKLRADVLMAIGADSSDLNAVALVIGGEEDDREYSLEEYTTNITEQAKEGKLDPVVGRAKEIERVIQILVRRKKNNPVLIGEPGVGKTAVAEGLAQRIIQRDVPDILEDKEIVALDIGLLLAGTKYRGEFEDRIKRIMEEVQTSTTIILVIDEIHNLIGAGAAEGAVDAANILKPALARGELQCIGATTIEEYRKHIEKDQALERRFQPVNVPEPSVDETIQILRGLRNRYERHHMLRISDGALVAAAKLGAQFIADRFLPDKAIDLIDEASARVRLSGCGLPKAAKDLDKELRELLQAKDIAIREQDFDEAGHCRDLEMEIRAQITALIQRQEGLNKNQAKYNPTVEEEDIAEIVAAWTGIPVSKVSKSETEKLIKMEEILHGRVIGQDKAVMAISRAIRRARVGLKNPNRPIASFIFSGPTGVGKTELTKALASYFFGSEDTMVRLDMSEYMERHNIAKLIGSPPGYVGFSEGGLLTEAVRRKPYTVVLFDEVEKAHPDVFNLLLQILEDGRLTDAQGRLVDFKNTLLILTSNIGSKVIEKGSQGGLGFETADDATDGQYDRISSAVNEELKQYFRPEFLNRLDEIIVFSQLTKQNVREIADIMVSQLCDRVLKQGLNLEVTDAVKEKLTDEGFNPIYGARPLRRAIMHLLEDNLAGSFLQTEFKKGSNIIVNLDSNGEVEITLTEGTDVPTDENQNEDMPQRRRFALSTMRKRKKEKVEEVSEV
jgi:ATP-dependent Clp protease ATP-binding subunit ClpC